MAEHPPFTGDIDIDSEIQRLVTEIERLEVEIERQHRDNRLLIEAFRQEKKRLHAEIESLREGLVAAGRQLAATEDYWQAEVARQKEHEIK